MDILVFEDLNRKSGEITDLIEKEFPMYNCELAIALKDAKDKISKKRYDFIIADLATPLTRTEGDKISKESGIEFLQYIFQSEGEQFFRPDEIAVLTKYADEIDIIKEIKEFPVSIICYEMRDEKWKTHLINRIYDIGRKYRNKVDMAIITAVQEEFNAFLFRRSNWKLLPIEHDANLYYLSEYVNQENGKKRIVKVLLTIQPEMGMVPAADLTHRVIQLFQPDCIIMSGICGGNKKDVSIGDIVVVEKAWDYGSGSMENVTDEEGNEVIKFEPAPEQIPADQLIIKEFRKYSTDKELKFHLRSSCDIDFNKDIEIKIGGMATGAAVIKNEKFVEEFIKPSHRKYYGIDMETYGMYYAANRFIDRKIKFISIKCVSDGADSDKSNQYQKFCARMAAGLTNHFIENVSYNIISE